MTTTSSPTTGLEAVIATESSVSFIDGTVTPSVLEYRGYSAVDLGKHASFEEVAHLLLRENLPDAAELQAFEEELAAHRALSQSELRFVTGMSSTGHSMDVLMAALGFAKATGTLTFSDPRPAAVELLAKMPSLVAAYFRGRQGLQPLSPEATASHAENYLLLLNGTSSPEVTRALDCLLTLYAEHELNASTFAVRVAASTKTDFHSAILAGLSALKGPLHGGATEDAINALLEIGSPGAVEEWVETALVEKRLIPGFGHRVYRTGDARTPLLRELCLAVAGANDAEVIEVAAALERYVGERKGLIANVDLYAAALMHFIGFPPDMLTAVVASSRVAGWSAHAIEQYDNNRIIRPRASYVGERNRTYAPPRQA